MTRKNNGEKQGRSAREGREKTEAFRRNHSSHHDASQDARIIVVNHGGGVLFRCDRRRHALAYLMGRGAAAAIYKRIASALEIGRELASYWPPDEDFPVIQTESL